MPSLFLSHILEGNTPHAVQPFLFGGSSLIHKRDGGLRAITVGLTLQWLPTKIGSGHIHVTHLDGSTLASLKLSFGMTSGCEVVVQAAHQYLASMLTNHVLLKIDFKNAFNSLRWNRILVAVQSSFPELYPFIWLAYRYPSYLFCGNNIKSEEGGPTR